MLHPTNPGRYLTKEEIQQYRLHLYEKQEGLCYWCANPMLFMEYIPEKHLQTHPTMATFEHLHDRLSITGRKNIHGTVVIACSKCNNDRNKDREALVIASLKLHFGRRYASKIRSISPFQLLQQLGIDPHRGE